ncbi:hypothetical protein GYMLUDRAFT_170191, partial [Collybiopsis luxurians FD-317 M1]
MTEPQKTFENLNSDNYNTWHTEAEAWLKVKGVWHHVNPDPKAVSLNVELALDTPNKPTDQAAGLLFLCIDKSQKAHVKQVKDDPRKVWMTLRDLHQQKKPGTRFSAFDDLFAITKKPDESLVDLAGHVSKAVQAIKALCGYKYSLEDLDKELESMALIRSLPSEYNNFVSSLLLLDTLEISKLREAF